MTESQVVVAMDWGGTWIRIGLVNKQGRILWQTRRANPQDGTKEEYLGIAAGLLAEAINQAGGSVLGLSLIHI